MENATFQINKFLGAVRRQHIVHKMKDGIFFLRFLDFFTYFKKITSKIALYDFFQQIAFQHL